MNCDKCGKDMVLEEFVEKAGLCTECYLENGRATGEEAKDERALTVPDIYLAEFVGVLRRVLKKQGDTMTITLWGRLDSWCDEQEEYLEEKYPTERKQGPCPIGLHFVAKPCESVAPEHTTASIIEDILNTMSAGIDKHTSSPFALGSIGRLGSIALHEQQYEQVKRTLRAREPKEPDIAAYVWNEIDERLADRLMKENNRIHTSVTFMPADGSEPVEAEPLKVMINPTLEELTSPICSCRQFQGDNLECPQHGKGSAWYDLHGGE